MNDLQMQLSYALAKQVPDMARGCSIETNYGIMHLGPEDAQKVAIVVEKLLRKRLQKLESSSNQPER